MLTATCKLGHGDVKGYWIFGYQSLDNTGKYPASLANINLWGCKCCCSCLLCQNVLYHKKLYGLGIFLKCLLFCFDSIISTCSINKHANFLFESFLLIALKWIKAHHWFCSNFLLRLIVSGPLELLVHIMGSYKAKIKTLNNHEIMSSVPLFGFNKYAHLNTNRVQASVLSPCNLWPRLHLCDICKMEQTD